MRIDVHAHYNPPVLADAFARVIGGRMLGTHTADLDPRIEAMNEAGIDRQIFWSSFQPSVSDATTASEAARLINDVYHEQKKHYDGRFDAWGSVPLPHIDETLSETARCLDDLGFAGIGLGCSVLDKPLDSEEFEPLWSELDDRSGAVFIHPGQTSAVIPGCGDYALGPALIWPAEIAVAGVRLVCAGVTERYPNIRFILAGGGGLIPSFGGTVDFLHEKIGLKPTTETSLRDGLARLFYDTSVRGASHQLRLLQELCGIDNIVFGSDAPFGSMKQSLEMIADQLGHHAADQIVSRNISSIVSAGPCGCMAHGVA